MTILKTNYNLYPAMGNLLDDFFSTELGDWNRNNYSEVNTTLPKVNILEDQEGFRVEMAAPGMKKEDFNVHLDKNLLTISSEKTGQGEESSFLRREFAYQSFQRVFTLPDTADGDKISAKYVDGILKVSIPKKEEAKPKPPKSISIS